MSGPALQARGLVRRYGDLEVLGGLDLAVAPGEVVAIVGPSGCGKTTLLNALAGYEAPDAGLVTRAGRTRTIHQANGLFPWLTARQNVALGLAAPGAGDRERRVEELLALVGLAGFGDHRPHELSGGMRQRAELARALAGDAPILLLDEPFSALDYQTRLRMRHELARLLAAVPRTVVLVTHDIEEAVQLADRVLVLTARPARVARELKLEGARPRDLGRPDVVAAAATIRDALGLGEPEVAPSAPAPTPGDGMRVSWAGVGVAAALGLMLAIVGRQGPGERPGGPRPTGTPAAAAPVAADDRPTLKVGHLPVTCHLTCPVTDYASKASTTTRFESVRFTEFASIAEAIKAEKLLATFMIAPLAMKLREQGVPVRITYLGHRDGSTIMVRKASTARSLADLRGRKLAIPSRYSNQFLVLRKLMADQGVAPADLELIELPPPDMPGALAAGAIDAYFVGEPFPAKAELAGTGRVLHHAKDVWPGFISCVMVVHETLIRERPTVVGDLVRGIAESGEWAETHRPEAARVAAPYFRQDEALVRFVLTRPPDRVSYRMLRPDPAEIARIRDMGVAAGILGRALPVADYLDLRFIPADIRPLALE